MKVHRVNNLSKIDLTKYKEGDLFITKSSVAILAYNRLRTFNFGQGLTKSDVQKMIDKSLNEQKEGEKV